MANFKSVDDSIKVKWGINPDAYKPWVESKKVLDLLVRYKASVGIKTDSDLAKLMGIKSQSIYQLKNGNGKMMAVAAIKWLDSLNIDPKLVLERIDGNEFDALSVLFLDIFSDKEERASMIRYQKEIKYLVQSLNAKAKQLKMQAEPV